MGERPRPGARPHLAPEREADFLAHPEHHVQLWFQDEARFGQQGSNSRVLADTGSRPRAPRQTEYEFIYLFGACCPEMGENNAR